MGEIVQFPQKDERVEKALNKYYDINRLHGWYQAMSWLHNTIHEPIFTRVKNILNNMYKGKNDAPNKSR